MTRCAIYARVSTVDQHTDIQLPDLRAFAARNDWAVTEYIEHASAKAGSKRPVLDRLLDDAKAKKFEVVLVWKIDRFGRSLIDFVNNVRALDLAGVRFVAPSQSIDTDQKSPFSKMIMHLLAIFAEFERDLIVERVRAGVAEYKRAYDAGAIGKVKHSKSGKNLPRGRPREEFDRKRAAEMHAGGMTWKAIGKALKVNPVSVRILTKRAGY